MRVLVVSRGKPDSEYPLNGIFEFDQATALAAIGVYVDFFSIDLRSFRRRRRWGVFHGIENGVNWHVINIPVGAFSTRILCFIGRIALNVLYKKVYRDKQDAPDIIHAHFTEMGYISATLSRKNSIPLIITEHSSKMNRAYVDSGILRCAKVGYSQASKLIAVSSKLAANVKKKTGFDATVIPNMIKSDVFSHVQRVEHPGFRIVTVSNLIPLKRTIYLIKAIEKLYPHHSDIRLDVIGDGPLKGELMEYVEKHGLDHCVKFHGYLPSKEIAKVFSETDCFALVSSTETFGVAWVEAMMAGIPVIATRCGGPEGFVNNDNGLMVDVDDQEQLEHAIIEMYNHEKNYQPSYIKQQMKKYSPDVVADELVRVYESVLKRKK